MVVIYIIQFTIGIVANSTVILVLALSPQKSTSSYHILHLAIADSLLLLSLPFNADSRFINKQTNKTKQMIKITWKTVEIWFIGL